MEVAGVERAGIHPLGWDGDDDTWAFTIAAKYPGRFAMTGRFNPQAPDGGEQLDGWLKQPGMVGIRLTIHREPRTTGLDDGTLDWFWPACERLGIPVLV